MALRPGDRVGGGYRIVRLLGCGGMGHVYEAVRGERSFAVKVFSANHGNLGFLRKRFCAEAKILSRLDSPRLVKVRELAINESDGAPYFAMDLVLNAEGVSETLEDARKTQKATEAQTMAWYEDLREGLEYIHSQGIVHRDVKLENVLLDAEGHAVLSDFGVSRIVDDRVRDELSVTMTFITGATTGTKPVMGTFWYLAPEIRRGGEATPASDWYALGVLMYRLLTGMWYEPNTKAFDLLAPFSQECQKVVRRLLADDPANRHPVVIRLRKAGCPMFWWSLGLVVIIVTAVVIIAVKMSALRADRSCREETSPPVSSNLADSLSLHYCKGVDFAFCPCPAGTNALGKMSLAVSRPYWLSDAPVTWRQWLAVRDEKYEGGWDGREEAPATYLTYDEVMSFCARLTRRFAKELPAGYEVRIPTVAEWRLAYQVGQAVTNRLTNDTHAVQRMRCENGWFGQGSNGMWETSNMKRYFEDRNRKVQLVSETWPEFPPRQISGKKSNWVRYSSKFVPVPVKQHPPNGLGLFDMHGNCFEMCADCVSTNNIRYFASEFGFQVRNPYPEQGLSLVDPVDRSGPMPTMLGAYFAPNYPGDEVWSTFFDRLPHLGFRLCIGPKLPIASHHPSSLILHP